MDAKQKQQYTRQTILTGNKLRIVSVLKRYWNLETTKKNENDMDTNTTNDTYTAAVAVFKE